MIFEHGDYIKMNGKEYVLVVMSFKNTGGKDQPSVWYLYADGAGNPTFKGSYMKLLNFLPYGCTITGNKFKEKEKQVYKRFKRSCDNDVVKGFEQLVLF